MKTSHINSEEQKRPVITRQRLRDVLDKTIITNISKDSNLLVIGIPNELRQHAKTIKDIFTKRTSKDCIIISNDISVYEGAAGLQELIALRDQLNDIIERHKNEN